MPTKRITKAGFKANRTSNGDALLRKEVEAGIKFFWNRRGGRPSGPLGMVKKEVAS